MRRGGGPDYKTGCRDAAGTSFISIGPCVHSSGRRHRRPSAGDAPAKASPSPRPSLSDSSQLDSLSVGSSRTPQPLTPCRAILVTETAAGIEGECNKGPVRAGGGWESDAAEARLSNRLLRFSWKETLLFFPHIRLKAVKGDVSGNWVQPWFFVWADRVPSRLGRPRGCCVKFGGVF